MTSDDTNVVKVNKDEKPSFMVFNESVVSVKGYQFTVHELSARNRKRIFGLFKDEVNSMDLQAEVIRMGCDLFSGYTVEQLLELPSTIFEQLYTKIYDISGLNEDSKKKD